MVYLDYPELATSVQLEREREGGRKILDPGLLGFLHVLPSGGGKRRAWSGFWCRAGGFRCLSCLLLLYGCQIVFTVDSCAMMALHSAVQWMLNEVRKLPSV